MSKCPECGSEGALVLWSTVECGSPRCKNFNPIAERKILVKAKFRPDLSQIITTYEVIQVFWNNDENSIKPGIIITPSGLGRGNRPERCLIDAKLGGAIPHPWMFRAECS